MYYLNRSYCINFDIYHPELLYIACRGYYGEVTNSAVKYST
jgi:hypothetical protein